MRTSSLDAALGETLRPLVELGASMRVAPFVNTLSLGLHYFLAHKDRSEAADRVDLADWNRMADLREALDGVFIFYSPRDVAAELSSLTGLPGCFSSVPVSRFRQRFVFVRRNPVTDELVNLASGKLCARFFDEAAARGFTIIVYTDIRGQAQALMDSVVPGRQPRVSCNSRWPVIRADEEMDLPLFIYGGPCSSYMLHAQDIFLSLSVDDSVVLSAPQYETHVIWHLPEGRANLNRTIRDTMIAYHKRLFEAATFGPEVEFQAMAAACNDTLAARHPSFPAETFADPANFQICLRDHHADPGSKGLQA